MIGKRVMLTDPRAARGPPAAGRIADLGRRCHPGVSHRSLESRRGGFIVALVTASRCLKYWPGQILRRNSCKRRIWICP